ncbi:MULTISPECIES: neutral zinc metallopeptidase [unclassified Mycolicibacterium]|uniref:neutral zinc metallopeptidase n=1 Tax=unclassified Mycolicibacterium TaxID=2636767 RepID=UPI00139099CB|nr:MULTISPECIES: neutral zinc metallopeptidase [unclassified Mycolicibacterium]
MPLPAPKRGARPAILIGSAAAIVVVLALVAAGVLVLQKQGTASASEPVSPAVAVPTAELTTTPSHTATTTPPPTTTSALPLPTGEAALGHNRIYANFDAGLAKQPCNPVGSPSDVAAAQAFLQAVMSCLNNAWEPLITAAGFEFRQPKLSIPTGSTVTSSCGTKAVGPNSGAAAFYCTSNETMYMPPVEANQNGDKAIVHLSILSHEYAHHLQSLIGTSEEWSKRTDAGGEGSAESLDVQRRYELQAQCLSGMFVGSIIDTGGRFTAADYQIALDDNSRRGDWDPNGARDHGSPAHFGAWWDQGYRENKIDQCNTWLSPASDVS